MKNIQIITDSTAYLTKDEIKEHNIKVVPLQVLFQGENKTEGFPGEFDEFFSQLKASEDFPITSQPSSGAFVKVFEEALEQGKEVLVILLSSNLSGTYNSAILATEILGSDKITVLDSQTSVANLRHMVLQAQKMVTEGKNRQEIAEYIEEQKTKMGIYLTVGTLEYLKKGGRLSNSQALIGSILDIKPILKIEGGLVVPETKVRGKKKALEIMMGKIPEQVKAIYIPHIYNEKNAEKMKKTLEKRFPQAKIELTTVGPVIGSHLGPKTLGVCFIW